MKACKTQLKFILSSLIELLILAQSIEQFAKKEQEVPSNIPAFQKKYCDLLRSKPNPGHCSKLNSLTN